MRSPARRGKEALKELREELLKKFGIIATDLINSELLLLSNKMAKEGDAATINQS
jgi:hypothetical protein